MMKKILQHITVWSVVLYLLIPLTGTFIYSLATEWTFTVLPQGLTLE